MNLKKDDFVVIAAVNDKAVLGGCLARSPDVLNASLPLIVIEGAESMTKAYNLGLSQTNRTICLFAHQDVYLPVGFLELAIKKLNDLGARHPTWRVAGAYGVKPDGSHVGRVWDVVIGSEIGAPGFDPTAVVSLDEILLILRRDAPFSFDEQLPGWHLYGTDLVQSSLSEGRGAFAVELPLVHNNRPISNLKVNYLKPYRYVRNKWRSRLPIPTTIIKLSYNPWYMWRYIKAGNHVSARSAELLADSAEIAKLAGYEGSSPSSHKT